MKKFLTVLTLLLLGGIPAAFAAERAAGEAAFTKLSDQLIDEYLKLNPTNATSLGYHQYDAELEDYSRKGIEKEIATWHGFLRKFQAMDRVSLSAPMAADRELVESQLRAMLLGLEKIRSWERNPDNYSSGLSGSIFTIMSRTFDTPEARLKSVIARERQAPAVLAAGRANLKNPPRIFTEIALEQLPGIEEFFLKDVPAAFKDIKDAELLKQFNAANGGVVEELKKYEAFLKDDLLPRSKGDFRLGLDNYRKKLLYEEMVDLPIDRLLKIGYANLRENQAALIRVAKEIDSKHDAPAVVADLVKDHPSGDHLLGAFRDTLGGLRKYLIDHHIVGVPSPVLPTLEETPAFERALTMASMDTPGPFEDRATEAYFNVTLPEPGWDQKRVEEHLEGFNHATIVSTAIHEAFPGHYVQFLWAKQAPSRVRKIFGCGSNIEGWAHYTEQMMLDEGYGNGDPKLRLGQLQDALLRNARFIVGIEMHTGKMTYDEGIRFFEKEGFQSHANAERETKRGTSDPTYLVYTLGKLEIMKLREDYRMEKGDHFKLEDFHNEFLKQGYPPIALLRKLMLSHPGEIL